MRLPLLAALVASAVLPACSGGTPFDPSPVEKSSGEFEARLAAAEKQWSRERPTAYTYRYGMSCFCAWHGTMTVTVRGGRVVSAQPDPGTPGLDYAPEPRTVEGLFALVRSYRSAQELEVEFDPRWGFPVRIDVNRSQQAFDGGVLHTAGDLAALPPS
jgi:hypothetical protein